MVGFFIGCCADVPDEQVEQGVAPTITQAESAHPSDAVKLRQGEQLCAGTFGGLPHLRGCVGVE